MVRPVALRCHVVIIGPNHVHVLVRVPVPVLMRGRAIPGVQGDSCETRAYSCVYSVLGSSVYLISRMAPRSNGIRQLSACHAFWRVETISLT